MQLPQIAPPLLAWYEQNKRILPFRTNSTPYRVWVSEIMLQQTRVSAALPYFERFTAELPDVADLAACDPERLHKLWEGLGYYSRVRNLQKAAQIVMQQYGGKLPADYDALRALPGIGDYTAGAIASISFNLPVPAVDGNVLRVFTRLLNDDRDVTKPAVKRELTAAVSALQPEDRPGDYNQALMELGALVCVPNGAPLCESCPLRELCRARALGIQETLPVKPPRAEKKVLDYTVLTVIDEHTHRVLLHKRPEKGLLAGLWEPVLLEGAANEAAALAALKALGVPARIKAPAPKTKHVFTHLIWQMRGYLCTADECPVPEQYLWADKAMLEQGCTLPNAFKAVRAVLKKNL